MWEKFKRIFRWLCGEEEKWLDTRQYRYVVIRSKGNTDIMCREALFLNTWSKSNKTRWSTAWYEADNCSVKTEYSVNKEQRLQLFGERPISEAELNKLDPVLVHS